MDFQSATENEKMVRFQTRGIRAGHPHPQPPLPREGEAAGGEGDFSDQKEWSIL